MFCRSRCLITKLPSLFRMSTLSEVNLDEVKARFRTFDGGHVSVSQNSENGIAAICLDHPERKNGLSGKMMVELNEAIATLEHWDAGKGLILYGTGDTFCSGGFLDTVRQICNSNDGYKMSALMHDTIQRFRRIPLVSLSIVQGKAIGGGAELMLATDFRLMVQDSYVAYVEARMGVGTGWGGGMLLRETVGRSMALDLLLTCRKVDAFEAQKIGLIDTIIPLTPLTRDETGRLEFAQSWLADRLSGHPVTVTRTVKQIVHCQNLQAEREYFAKSWGSQEQKDALSSNKKHT